MALYCYCPRGHRIEHSGVKPANCPTCGSEMEPKLVAPPLEEYSDASFAPRRHPARSRPMEVETYEDDDGEDLGGYAFDRGTAKVIKDNSVMTVKDLKASGMSVERVEASESSPGGSNTAVRTEDLVAEIIAQSPQMAQASVQSPAVKPRRARRSKGQS